MRWRPVTVALLLGAATSAQAQVTIELGLPSIRLGFDVRTYPELVLVPGTPVYYDPRASSNYFFYDGLYWVYGGDNWYSSPWYNGPWELVGYYDVPFFVLRIPVRYYRQPPTYFRGWAGDAPPRWGEHWGRDWEGRRAGWDRWDRREVPQAAPLPVYQRQYSGDRYPRAAEQQHAIRTEHYQYQPREKVTQQHFQRPAPARAEPARAAPQPAAPPHAAPPRAEPQRAEPQRATPQRAEPPRSEPPRAAPARAEPQHAAPARAEPQRAEPSRAAPQRAEPPRAEPQRAGPQRQAPPSERDREPQDRGERGDRH